MVDFSGQGLSVIRLLCQKFFFSFYLVVRGQIKPIFRFKKAKISG